MSVVVIATRSMAITTVFGWSSGKTDISLTLRYLVIL